jgi:hypothetical protein
MHLLKAAFPASTSAADELPTLASAKPRTVNAEMANVFMETSEFLVMASG